MSKLLLLATVLVAATLGVPMVAQANSHADRAISYDTQSEPVPTPGLPAEAVNKQLWHSTHYDTVASTLAGFPIVAVGEDDYNEWGSFLWNRPLRGARFHDGLRAFVESLLPSDFPRAADLVDAQQDRLRRDRERLSGRRFDGDLTLIHEAYHQRLYSGDESRVNACALRDFGSTIQSQFGVSPTVEETVTTPVVTSHRVRTAVWRTIKAREPALDAD